MFTIEDLKLFSTLLRSPSLSAAARILNVTPPALSMRLKKLELELGVNLAVRNARRLSLTAEGEQLAVQAESLLAQMDTLSEMLQRKNASLAGNLRIAAPFGFGRQHIAPLVGRFVREHPLLSVNLDLLETPWPDKRDADVIVHIGSVRDSSWIVHPIATNERWLCASPGYLKSLAKRPERPRDLLEHNCICIRENDDDVTLWHYAGRAGTPAAKAGGRESLRITPFLTSNDGDVARQWAEQGLGVVLRSQWDAAPAVASGRLVRLLEDWVFDSAPIVALVPTRKGVTARAQIFVKFMQAGFLEPNPLLNL